MDCDAEDVSAYHQSKPDLTRIRRSTNKVLFNEVIFVVSKEIVDKWSASASTSQASASTSQSTVRV